MTATTQSLTLPESIVRLLRRTRRQLRAQTALAGLGYGLAMGLVLGVGIALVARLRPLWLPEQTLLYALVALVAATILGGLLAAARPLSLGQVARRADHDLSLRERLSTALELVDGQTRSTLAAAHLTETARLVEERGAAPLRWPQPAREQTFVLGLLALTLSALLVLPNAQTAAVQQQQANQQLVQQAAQQIAQVQSQVNNRTDLDPATQQAIQQRLAQLQQELETGKLDPAQAVAKIAETEAGLRRLQDPTAAQRGAALPKLGDELGTFSATAPVGQRIAAGDYAGAGQALKDFSNGLGTLDPASQAAIARKLREAAATQAATNPQLAQQLQAAADALDRGDIAAAQAALNSAADQIAQTGQAVATQQALSGVLGDIGAIKIDVANGLPPTTANATPQRPSGTPVAINGTPVTLNGTPVTINGTPGTLNGTPATIGNGGTPVRPDPNGTPVIVPGTGQSSVTGQGQGQNPGGSGPGGSGAGSGPGNGNNGQTPPNQPTGNPSGGNGGAGQTSPYDPVYAPTLPSGVQGQQQGVSGNGSDPSAPVGTVQGSGATTNSTVPYDQVYQQYVNQALQGIDDPSIPPELRDYIRQYFSNIDPSNQNR